MQQFQQEVMIGRVGENGDKKMQMPSQINNGGFDLQQFAGNQAAPDQQEELPAYLFTKPTIGRKGNHRRTRSSMPDELNKIAFQSSAHPVKPPHDLGSNHLNQGLTQFQQNNYQKDQIQNNHINQQLISQINSGNPKQRIRSKNNSISVNIQHHSKQFRPMDQIQEIQEGESIQSNGNNNTGSNYYNSSNKSEVKSISSKGKHSNNLSLSGFSSGKHQHEIAQSSQKKDQQQWRPKVSKAYTNQNYQHSEITDKMKQMSMLAQNSQDVKGIGHLKQLSKFGVQLRQITKNIGGGAIKNNNQQKEISNCENLALMMDLELHERKSSRKFSDEQQSTKYSQQTNENLQTHIYHETEEDKVETEQKAQKTKMSTPKQKSNHAPSHSISYMQALQQAQVFNGQKELMTKKRKGSKKQNLQQFLMK